jgi:adenylate kinase
LQAFHHLNKIAGAPAYSSGKPLSILLFGPPCSGKSKLGKRLAEGQVVMSGSNNHVVMDKPEFYHLSTGDILRELEHDTTNLGRLIRDFRDEKKFFPDDLVGRLVELYLIERQVDGSYNSLNQVLLLNGMPRTEKQVSIVNDLVNVVGIIRLEAPINILLERAQARQFKGSRFLEGDFDYAICRLNDYYTKTLPALKQYPNEFICNINTYQNPDETYSQALRAINKFMPLE